MAVDTDTSQSAHLRFWLAAIALTSLILRLIYYFEFKKTVFFNNLQIDAKYYWEWAGRIANGELIGNNTFDMSPLYPYLLGLYRYFFGSSFAPLYLIQILLGTLTVILIFLTANKLHGLKAAILAGFIAACYKPHIMFEVAVMKSFLSALLLIGSTYLLLGTSVPAQLGAGVLLALAAVNDGHYLLLTPFICHWLWWSQQAEKRVRSIAVFILGMLIAFSPVLVRNLIVSGEVTLVRAGGGYVFYIGAVPRFNGEYRTPDFVEANPLGELRDFPAEARKRTGNPDLTIKQASNYWYQEGIKLILENPLVYLKNVGRRFLIYFNSFEFPDNYNYQFLKTQIPLLRWWLFDFSLVGSLGLWFLGSQAWKTRSLSLPALLVIGGVSSLLPFMVFGRLRLGITPILIVSSGAALIELYSLLQKKRPKEIMTYGGGLLIVFLLVNWPLQLAGDSMSTSYSNTGLLCLDADKPDQALDYFLEALKLDKANSFAHEALLLYQTDPKLANNAELSEKVSRVYEKVSAMFMPNAQADLDKGRNLDALNSFNLILSYRINNLTALNGAAEASLKLGNPRNALSYSKLALRIDSKNADIYRVIAKSYLALGNKKAAKMAYEKLIGIAPNDSEALLFLAR